MPIIQNCIGNRRAILGDNFLSSFLLDLTPEGYTLELNPAVPATVEEVAAVRQWFHTLRLPQPIAQSLYSEVERMSQRPPTPAEMGTSIRAHGGIAHINVSMYSITCCDPLALVASPHRTKGIIMRALFVLPLVATLTACLPVATVSLSGPGTVPGRGSICRTPTGHITIALPEGLELKVDAEENGSNGYRLNAYIREDKSNKKLDPTMRLLALRTTLSTTPGYALLEQMSGGAFYNRQAGDEKEEITLSNGTLLRNFDFKKDVGFQYTIPNFFEASTDLTLPPLLIDGKRFDIPPITLHKGIGIVALCAH